MIALTIWIVVGAAIGLSYAAARKHTSARMIGDAVVATVFAVAGGWLLGLFGVAIGGPYLGAAVNAAIGTALLPIFLVLLDGFA